VQGDDAVVELYEQVMQEDQAANDALHISENYLMFRTVFSENYKYLCSTEFAAFSAGNLNQPSG
jgi:hypothetical protein